MISQNAKKVFDAHNFYGRPLENHCRRLTAFASAIAQMEGWPVDQNLVTAASWLHDLGLLIANDEEPNYLYRQLNFARTHYAAWGLNEQAALEMDQMLLFNHCLVPIKGLLWPAEAMRRAVQVEHSFGVISHGLRRSFRKEVFARYPRDGFNQVLWGFTKTSFSRDGALSVGRLFFPKVSPI